MKDYSPTILNVLRKDEKKVDTPWDKKKIVIVVLFLLVILFAGLYVKSILFGVGKKTAVEGAYTQISTPQDAQISNASQNFEQKINQIQQNVNNLNVVDVATSTPQVQKIINDIKSLQSLPTDQAKSACQKICEGL